MPAAELEGQGRVRQCCIYVCMVLIFLLRDVVSLSHQRDNSTKTARHVLRSTNFELIGVWNTAFRRCTSKSSQLTLTLLTPPLSCATERLSGLEHSTPGIVNLIPAQHHEVASNVTSIICHKSSHNGRSNVRLGLVAAGSIRPLL